MREYDRLRMRIYGLFPMDNYENNDVSPVVASNYLPLIAATKTSRHVCELAGGYTSVKLQVLGTASVSSVQSSVYRSHEVSLARSHHRVQQGLPIQKDL